VPPTPFTQVDVSDAAHALRAEVRAFLHDSRDQELFEPRCDAWLTSPDPDFSARLGERGWLGLTWPTRYGGSDRSTVERYVVIEELLAAGAPVAAHWMAERQVGPGLLRHGTEEQRERYLPAIASGTCFFSIGLSEPDTGSDLASVRTAARVTDGGWRVTGRKLWTTHAHRSHHLLALCRTGVGSTRQDGLSQLIIDLHAPGVSVRPIAGMSGGAHFGEVTLEDVFVADADVVGVIGSGWSQVMSELAFERSGPERFLSTFPLLECLVADGAGRDGDGVDPGTLGTLIANLQTLRRLSLQVAAQTANGQAPGVAAALVKDLGTAFERDVIEAARLRLDADAGLDRPMAAELTRHYRDAVLAAPTFTLRGGTTEMMRSIVARELTGR
jgi:acyl-CoA dehydrogenase